jgi:multisubunit Na+/H+ antiporter MnhB subunit
MERGSAAHERRTDLLGAALWGGIALAIDAVLLWAMWLPGPRLGEVDASLTGLQIRPSVNLALLLLLLVGGGAGIGVMAAGYWSSGARRLRCAAEGALLVHLAIPVFLVVRWMIDPQLAHL